ncbi:hypothetical protein GQR58_001810 [Nymphon striatum]|nr:hypothetical protein GQR58_001810 [Nymphon striatum]
MKFKQIVFALLFISGIKKFTNHYIEKHYGTDGMKYFHLYADSRRKLKKCQLDLDFLLKCKIYNMFPKFLRFKLYRKSLQQSKFYRSWQTKLLNLEINNKRKRIQQLEEDLHKADTRISNNFTTIDQYLLRKRVNSNIKSFMDQTITTHQRKLSNLGINNQIAPCDPEKCANFEDQCTRQPDLVVRTALSGEDVAAVVFSTCHILGAGSMFEALIFDLVQLVMLLQMVDVSQVDEDLQVSITVEYGASIASKKGTQPQTKKYTPATQQRSAANLPGVSGNSAI